MSTSENKKQRYHRRNFNSRSKHSFEGTSSHVQILPHPEHPKKNRKARTAKKRAGLLRPVAVDFFERYHGLNGREKEDFSVLLHEVNQQFKASEEALLSIVQGHSYHDLLHSLRQQVPGYPMQMPHGKRNQQRRLHSKSCEPSLDSQWNSFVYPTYTFDVDDANHNTYGNNGSYDALGTHLEQIWSYLEVN